MSRLLSRRMMLASPALLARCGGPPPPAPPVLELQIVGGPDQNPDYAGRPVSVAVHVYQLTNAARFGRADVFALLEREKQTLGADSPTSEEFLIAPGETKTIMQALKPDVAFVGIAVFFREIDHAMWRAVAPVAPQGTTRLVVHLNGINASLAPA